MAAFPPPFGAGLAFGAIVPSGGGAGLGLNGINDNLPKAPNLVDGDATYNPAIGVTIGGGGIFISGTGWRLVAASQINNYGGSFVGQAGVVGLTVTGGAGATGLAANGTGIGGGVFATGGATNGPGATGTGGGTTGIGLIGLGASGGTGVYAESGTSTIPALIISTGNARFSAASPTATADPGFNSFLCGANVCKAWAMVQVAGGVATLLDGYNIASVTRVATTHVLVTFARSFASVNYCPVVTGCDNPGVVAMTDFATRAVNTLEVAFQTHAGGAVDPSAVNVRFALQVMGRQ